MRRHIDLPGLRWHRITAGPADDPGLAPFRSAHDLFGDGSLVLLPTPGHTPGSLSLLVRRPGPAPLLMVGDLSYDAHLLEAGHVPGAALCPMGPVGGAARDGWSGGGEVNGTGGVGWPRISGGPVRPMTPP